VNVSGVVPTKPEEILFTSPIVRGFPAEIYSDGLATFGNTTTADDPTSLIGLERIEVVKGQERSTATPLWARLSGSRIRGSTAAWQQWN
jgi:hypothetical protein